MSREFIAHSFTQIVLGRLDYLLSHSLRHRKYDLAVITGKLQLIGGAGTANHKIPGAKIDFAAILLPHAMPLI